MPSAWDQTADVPAKPAVSAWDATPDTPLPEKKMGSGSALVDAGNAVGTGFFRGLTALAGLPFDTMANVLDLGKAAVGSAYTAATGKPPPKALELGDRADVLGSGANLQRTYAQLPGTSTLVTPVNPEYEGGYLQNAGAALSGVASPNSKAELAKQILLSVGSATAAKATKDLTGNDALAVAASLAPQGAAHYGAEGVKRFIRGGEEGRAKMQARMLSLEQAGVSNPTLGLASGNETIGGVENLLQSTPGAVGVMRRAREQALAGLLAKTQEAADLASPNRGSTATGGAIQQGLGTAFKEHIKDRTQNLYDALDQHIDARQPTRVDNTLQTLGDLTATIPGAENVSQRFVNGRIASLATDFKKDTAGAPASVHVYSQPPKAGGGIMNAPVEQPPLQVVIPAQPPTNSLPWEAVKKTRTMIGQEMADGALVSGAPDRQWRALYGSLSEDMGNAARQAERTNSPGAEQAFTRATDYNRAAMGRLERVAPFANASSPEQAYNMLTNAANERGSLSTLQAVKKSLPQDARGQIAGTVIERLGQATSGQQNATGTAWSPETFLTNWSRMTPKAREELFSGFNNSAQVKSNVESVANAADMMRQNSKLWANPSGTGANWAARGALGALGIGGTAALQGVLNPYIPLGVGAGMGTANLLARILTSKDAAQAAASQTRMTQNDVSSLVRMLQATGTTP